jgi:CheY-like chemotaxis protein
MRDVSEGGDRHKRAKPSDKMPRKEAERLWALLRGTRPADYDPSGQQRVGKAIAHAIYRGPPEPLRNDLNETALNGVRVLLLEDEAIVNFAVTDLLREFGCRVSSCMHPHDALAIIEHDLPDAAVLDVNIRGQTTYDVAEKLHERGVPIVFLTGYTTLRLAGKWNEFPNCFKPCAPAELKALLIKALTTRRGSRS